MDPDRTSEKYPSRASQRIDPEIADSARQSVTPDPDTYDRPATTRITPANLGLSTVALIVGVILVIVLLIVVF